MTTALYRRYRPESFAEVIGQEQVTGPLSIALSKNRVNHAYLFSGPRGCGKTTSARILARCLNCEQGPTPTPCGVCPSCVELARGGPGSLDVVEIDAASHGGVDDARDLRERAAFAPVRDRYKVFIIDEAHMVSPQGFNALLKIVEEPPEHIRFIFATTEPEKVIGTIRSRTHHYPFRLVPPERLTSYLAELCEREGVEAGKGVLPLVVRSGGGSVRDSLSVLDQLIGGSGEEGLTYPTAIALLGYTDGALLDDVADALAAGDGATVFRVIDRVIESGHDPRRFVEDLLERMRDLLVVAALRDGGHAVFRGMPDDQLERMRSQAGRFGAVELSRAADVTNAALTEMTGATSPRLQLELLCARLLLPSAAEGERGIGARLDRLEKRINATGGLVAPAGVPPADRVPPGSDRPAQRPASGPVAAPAARAAGPAPGSPSTGDVGSPSSIAGSPSAAGGSSSAGSGTSPGGSAGSSAQSGAANVAGPGQGWPEPSRAENGARPAEPERTRPPAEPERGRPVSEPVVDPASGPGVSTSGPGGSTSGAGDLEAVRRMWTEVLNALASIKRTTWSLVSQYAQVLDYDGRRLMLGFDSAGRAQSFSRGAHPDFLRQALIDVIGLDCVVEAVASSEFRAGSAASAPQRPPASAPPARPASSDSAPRGSSAVAAPTAPAPRQAPAARPATRSPDSRPAASPAGPESPAGSGPSSARPDSSSSGRPDPSPARADPSADRSDASSGHSGAPAVRPSTSVSARPARSGSPAGGAGDRSVPEPEPAWEASSVPASPYDDIPPALEEPVWDDEVPPDDGRSGPRSRPAPQTSSARPPSGGGGAAAGGGGSRSTSAATASGNGSGAAASGTGSGAGVSGAGSPGPASWPTVAAPAGSASASGSLSGSGSAVASGQVAAPPRPVPPAPRPVEPSQAVPPRPVTAPSSASPSGASASAASLSAGERSVADSSVAAESPSAAVVDLTRTEPAATASAGSAGSMAGSRRDEPFEAGDPGLGDAHMVGTEVVQALLGGLVIEELDT